jgi:hypothetical protein
MLGDWGMGAFSKESHIKHMEEQKISKIKKMSCFQHW